MFVHFSVLIKTHLKQQLFFCYEYKMNKTESLKFGEVEVEKQRLHFSKTAIRISNMNNDNIVISEIFSSAIKVFKNFVGYKKHKEVTPLCVKMSG